VGTHDPAMFIAPANLATRLKACGFTVSDFTGLGPCGLNSKLDFVFGPLPSTMIMYMGHAFVSTLSSKPEAGGDNAV